MFEAKQHGQIELSRLAPGEREVIAKAASVRPEERYANTAQMVRALRNCGPAGLSAGRSAAAESTDACIPGPLRDTDTPGPSRFRPVSDATAGRKSFVCFLAGLAILAVILFGLMVVSRFHGDRGHRPDAPAGIGPAEATAPAQGAAAGTTSLKSSVSAATGSTVPPESGAPISAGGTLDAGTTAGLPGQSVQNIREIAEATRASAQNTKTIAEAARQSAENTKEIAETTRQISLSLEAIREIRYGLDTEEVDRTFPLSEPDPLKPSSISPGEKIYVTIPASTRFLAVQLTYRDGTMSKVARFDRSAGSR